MRAQIPGGLYNRAEGVKEVKRHKFCVAGLVL